MASAPPLLPVHTLALVSEPNTPHPTKDANVLPTPMASALPHMPAHASAPVLDPISPQPTKEPIFDHKNPLIQEAYERVVEISGGLVAAKVAYYNAIE